MMNESYTVTVIRDEGTWCAVVAGVEDAQVWGAEFEELEAGIRTRLEQLRGVTDAELTWHVDSDGDGGPDGTDGHGGQQTPLSVM
jgi:hypothetical protein